MDTWIDKVMVIRTRFMWDIEKQLSGANELICHVDVLIFILALAHMDACLAS